MQMCNFQKINKFRQALCKSIMYTKEIKHVEIFSFVLSSN